MSDFVIQFAIRLPSGALYCRAKRTPMTYSMFGGIPLTEPERELAVFDDRADAEKLLDEMREYAAEVGVEHLGATIVQRLCSPFTAGDPGDDFAAAVIEWVANEGKFRD